MPEFAASVSPDGRVVISLASGGTGYNSAMVSVTVTDGQGHLIGTRTVPVHRGGDWSESVRIDPGTATGLTVTAVVQSASLVIRRKFMFARVLATADTLALAGGLAGGVAVQAQAATAHHHDVLSADTGWHIWHLRRDGDTGQIQFSKDSEIYLTVS